MYYSGRGVPQDYSVAAPWFQKAAEGGDRVAYVDLGVLYREGRGVPKDPVAAYMWFSLAAKEGDDYSKKALPHLSASMSSEQLARARVKEDEWIKSHPK